MRKYESKIPSKPTLYCMDVQIKAKYPDGRTADRHINSAINELGACLEAFDKALRARLDELEAIGKDSV